MKLKRFILQKHKQEEEKSRKYGRTGRGRINPSQGAHKDNDENYKTAYIALAVLFAFAIYILIGNEQDEEFPLDVATLCPVESKHITGKTYILMDLSEPLSFNQRQALRDLLKEASGSLRKDEQLIVSRMRPNPYRPREEMLSFCNSVDIGSIKDSVGRRVSIDDCSAILGGKFTFHRGIREEIRKRIRGVCENHGKVQGMTRKAVNAVPEANREQKRSYIVRNIEDIINDANLEPGGIPTRLVVFSDMLQNSEWFSQYAPSRHGPWTIENLTLRREKALYMGEAPQKNVLAAVLLCLLPNNTTGTAKLENNHRLMWRSYFKGIRFVAVSYSGCAAAVKSVMRAK